MGEWGWDGRDDAAFQKRNERQRRQRMKRGSSERRVKHPRAGSTTSKGAQARETSIQVIPRANFGWRHPSVKLSATSYKRCLPHRNSKHELVRSGTWFKSSS